VEYCEQHAETPLSAAPPAITASENGDRVTHSPGTPNSER
jgi:hypothetical protein